MTAIRQRLQKVERASRTMDGIAAILERMEARADRWLSEMADEDTPSQRSAILDEDTPARAAADENAYRWACVARCWEPRPVVNGAFLMPHEDALKLLEATPI